jgi:hypothetical protein
VTPVHSKTAYDTTGGETCREVALRTVLSRGDITGGAPLKRTSRKSHEWEVGNSRIDQPLGEPMVARATVEKSRGAPSSCVGVIDHYRELFSARSMFLQVGSDVFDILGCRGNVRRRFARFEDNDSCTTPLGVNHEDSGRERPFFRGRGSARFKPLKPAKDITYHSPLPPVAGSIAA